MSGRIHTAQELTAVRSGLDVILYIRGAGSLTMPRDAAHELAREMMRVIGEIDALQKRAARNMWPNLQTKC